MLDFTFEDKLKKFIEENCGYNFNIVIRKTQSGVEINDFEDDPKYSQERINDVLDAARELCGEIDGFGDVPDSVINAEMYLEEAIDNLDLDF